jgi:hypothetical protein
MESSLKLVALPLLMRMAGDRFMFGRTSSAMPRLDSRTTGHKKNDNMTLDQEGSHGLHGASMNTQAAVNYATTGSITRMVEC